ncbi:hypothetical protein [Natronococcus sp. A-GB7]|uniref:hypothetical protein n=1 Tax=Natronococcus sp. A-GB7 TaxID=3037649 RepID=UPI00241DD468|nr:hypothetical protein [Natronococcus sp. A-GB7]MDG5818272.1 hypothetical protein [Natronococcus sp. A-GB7]
MEEYHYNYVAPMNTDSSLQKNVAIPDNAGMSNPKMDDNMLDDDKWLEVILAQGCCFVPVAIVIAGGGAFAALLAIVILAVAALTAQRSGE